MLDDKYPIISDLEFLGLLTALTSIDCKKVITEIKNILREDPNFFQFILKIIPIDFVCETNLNIISQLVKNHYKDYIDSDESYKIDLKRRNKDFLEREIIITNIAKKIENKVDLSNPNKIIRIELLGNFCGISFLKPDEIIRIKKQI